MRDALLAQFAAAEKTQTERVEAELRAGLQAELPRDLVSPLRPAPANRPVLESALNLVARAQKGAERINALSRKKASARLLQALNTVFHPFFAALRAQLDKERRVDDVELCRRNLLVLFHTTEHLQDGLARLEGRCAATCPAPNTRVTSLFWN